jgi:hypothetical protein
MTEKYNPNRYPQEYIAGFMLADDEAVNRVLQHLLGVGVQVDAVVIEDGYHGTVVHTLHGDVLDEVNWADPTTAPKDLKGYANTVYMFAGPDAQQRRRAEMLAQATGAVKGVISMQDIEAESTLVQLMGSGMRIRKPKGWNFFSSDEEKDTKTE